MRRAIAATVLFLGASLGGALPASALNPQPEPPGVQQLTTTVYRILRAGSCVQLPTLGGIILPPNPCLGSRG